MGAPGTRLPHPLLPAGRAGLYLSFFLLASGMNQSCHALLLDGLPSPTLMVISVVSDGKAFLQRFTEG